MKYRSCPICGGFCGGGWRSGTYPLCNRVPANHSFKKNGVSKIMTDKELLELAAKAAGIIDGHWLGDCFWVGAYDGGYEWNPLTDDGDALRLAVKLELTIGKPFEHKIALVWLDDITSFAGNSEKEGGIYAATRRAIVRAAAKIGKEIK